MIGPGAHAERGRQDSSRRDSEGYSTASAGIRMA
jgi:hypothetical protein